MKCSKRSFAVVSVLFALILSLSTGTLNARDAEFASRTFAAHTAKRKCINTCRARYRDCLSLKQIPSSECRGVYRDCTRFTCNARSGALDYATGGQAAPFLNLLRSGVRLLLA